jgi:hypothetical protein
MTLAAAAIFKMPTTGSPQGQPRPQGGCRTAEGSRSHRWPGLSVETRAATRGDGEVIELDLGITVYPPRQDGGRWQAVWYEDGERQQCKSVSEDKLAGKLEKAEARHGRGEHDQARRGPDRLVPQPGPA